MRSFGSFLIFEYLHTRLSSLKFGIPVVKRLPKNNRVIARQNGQVVILVVNTLKLLIIKVGEKQNMGSKFPDHGICSLQLIFFSVNRDLGSVGLRMQS